MNLLIVLIILGILPSLIWLLFFLRKDSHPESNRAIIKVFFWGILATLPAILFETGLLIIFGKLGLPPRLLILVNTFIGVALVEEMLKYLVTKRKAIFDEPIDTMIYMIIAALGFAASENILILLTANPFFSLEEIFAITILRFVGATLLHALCSGAVGYFIALSFLQINKRKRWIFSGITIATLLHGLYNFSIMEMEGILSFLVPVTILISLAIFSAIAFKNLKNRAFSSQKCL